MNDIHPFFGHAIWPVAVYFSNNTTYENPLIYYIYIYIYTHTNPLYLLLPNDLVCRAHQIGINSKPFVSITMLISLDFKYYYNL